MIKRIFLATTIFAALNTDAQIRWPEVKAVTKPWTRWWWLGSAVNNKDLTANMEQYAAAGLGGLEITPIYGVAGYEDQFIDYLSPKWMQVFTHTLQEAKRLNMQIDMATGSGWPFGGGPLIGDEDACKNFVYKTWFVKAGETVKEPIAFEQQPYIDAIGNTLGVAYDKDVSKLKEPVFANTNLQALAIDQLKYKKNLPLQVVMAYGDNGQAIDITKMVDAKGNLNWTAPAGNWTVYALFMGWHGKMVERAAPGADQLQKVTANGLLLQAPGGTYRTIILANVKYLPLPTLQKLAALAKSGARIIVYKNFPGGVPGYGELQTRQKQFTDITASLKFVANGGVQKAMTGKGAFIKGDDLSELLKAGNVEAEPMYGMGLQCIRRSIAGGTYYFISNTSGKAITEWVPLNRKGVSAILFDAMTQKSGIARTRFSNDKMEVYVQLQPGESCILQTAGTQLKGDAYTYYTGTGEAFEIKGTWNLKYLSGGPELPKETIVTTLGSWTELPDAANKIFAGTAQYSIHFAKPAGTDPAYVLDLGKVAWSAEVLLNGKSIATLLGPTYRVTIPAGDLKADNLLEIKVSNGMTNRIIDLEKRGVHWKKFYNTNFPARLAENRGANGLFTAAAWQPEESGLLGPVTIASLSSK